MLSMSFLVILVMGIGSVQAVDGGTFQLDGNALTSDNPFGSGTEDWDTLYASGALNGGTATAYTFIIDKNGQDDYFTGGGSKTPNDINQWLYKNAPPSAPPPKDDITNAYAANYIEGVKQVIVFGADVFATNGSAELGFWFFQQKVSKKAYTGASTGFDGLHTLHDPYIAVKFLNGGSVASITTFEWDDSCTKQMVPKGTATEDLIAGDCAADNIRVVVANSDATCDGNGSKVVCAISNDTSIKPSPWPYLGSGGETEFPITAFFEGGINIHDTFGNNLCFSSFMVTTGASASFTATSKDFALDDFDVCSVAVTKTCVNDSEADDATDAITYDIRGCGYNDGGGDIKITSLQNSIAGGTKYLPADLDWYIPGQVDDGSGGFRDFDPETDCKDKLRLKQAVDNGTLVDVSLPASVLAGGDAFVYQFSETTAMNGVSDEVFLDADGTDGTDIDDATDTATCPLRTFNAELSVTKRCAADLEVNAGEDALEVVINVEGEVCNLGEVQLTGLVLTDDTTPSIDGVTLTPVITTLAPVGESDSCTTYSGNYTPNSIPTGDLCPFADQVLATANAPINSTGNNCDVLDDLTSDCTAMSNTATCELRVGNGDDDCSTGLLKPDPTPQQLAIVTILSKH